MNKGPLNYTTTIAATKTAGECIAMLAELEESMLAYVHVAPGITMAQAWRENEHLALTAGD